MIYKAICDEELQNVVHAVDQMTIKTPSEVLKAYTSVTKALNLYLVETSMPTMCYFNLASNYPGVIEENDSIKNQPEEDVSAFIDYVSDRDSPRPVSKNGGRKSKERIPSRHSSNKDRDMNNSLWTGLEVYRLCLAHRTQKAHVAPEDSSGIENL
ncbi:unnamed protein product [Arabidopsis halleri]